MASFVTNSARIRLTNEDNVSICSVGGISPTVTADTAAAFVAAIEKLYNDGQCDARMTVAMDIVR